jgi:ligand-binding sensor domain-containing protein
MKAFHLLILLSLFLISCNGQKSTELQRPQKNIKIKAEIKAEIKVPLKTAALPGYLMLKSLRDDDLIFDFESSVRSIFEDSKGNFWYGTDKDGVFRFDGMSMRHFTIGDDLPDHQIHTIQEDQEGNIWFSTRTSICRFDGKKMTIMARTNVREVSHIKGQHQDWKKTKGDLWFEAGFNEGAYRYDGKVLTYLAFPIPETDALYDHSDDGYSVFSIHESDNNNIWFGTVSKGVIHYNGKSFEYINDLNLHAAVRSIFQSTDGQIWFGNNGAGVFQYDGKTLSNFTDEKGVSNPSFANNGYVSDRVGTLARIWAIEQDNDGNMWFATIDAGVWKYDGETLTSYTKKDGLSNNAVEAIYKDKKGKLWFGSKGAVFTFNGKSFDKFVPVTNC